MTPSIHQIRAELQHLSQAALADHLLRLARFKKENKELLTYLLFRAHDEDTYIQEVKEELDPLWEDMNRSTYYYMKKSVRKILRILRLRIRFSGKAETEVELLIWFCQRLSTLEPDIRKNSALRNLLDRQQQQIRTKLKKLHPDLRHDLEALLSEVHHS